MTSPPFKPGSASRFGDAPGQQPAPKNGMLDLESPRQLGVLILGDAPEDDVAAIVAGANNSVVGPEGDRAPTSAPSPQPDALVFDLRSTDTANSKGGRRVTNAYLVLLDEHGASSDQIVGLSIDAGEAPSGPVSAKELVSRVRAMLRRYPRQHVPDPGPRRIADLMIDTTTREVRRGNDGIELTRTEFDILDALSTDPGKIVSRGQLLKAAWGPDWYGNDHVVDVHMSKLRRKLDDPPNSPRYIRTIRGVGFRLLADAVSRGA